MKKSILVICDDNSLYSPLAEAYLKNYAGHWKNSFSAGIHTKDKKMSPFLRAILAEDSLENKIDYQVRGIEEYQIDTFDYIMALTSSAFEYCKKKFPEKEILLLILKSSNEQNEKSARELSAELKLELLRFVKNGPIKKWGENI